jgi:hypothetical protein
MQNSRRTAATLATNNQATGCQMTTHFGWANPKMAQEYIDGSKDGIFHHGLQARSIFIIFSNFLCF